MTDRRGPTAAGTNSPAMATSGGKLAVYTSLDQALSSLSNALLLFAIAQTASVAQFGVITLLVALVSTVMCFNRGALGTPILLVSNLRSHEIRTESGYAVTWAAASAVVTAVILVVVGAATGSLATGIAFAIAVPAILVQDVLRFSALSFGRPLAAVASDGVWVALMTGLYLLNVAGDVFTRDLVVLLWGAGGLISGVALAVTIGVRPRCHRAWRWWRTYDIARIRFGCVQALIPIATALFIFTITLILGAAVAGGLRGASTLFGPIAMLVSALPLAFVPHARRSNTSIEQQWRILVRISWAASVITIVGTIVLIALPTHLGQLLLGDTWGSAVAVVPFVGLEVAANCWMVGVYAMTQAQGMSNTALWLRIFEVIVKQCAAVVAALTIGTALGVAAGGAAAAVLSAVVSLEFTKRAIRNHASEPSA